MEANLFALTGPIKGALFRLHDEEVSLGRHPSNQLCISDPSVSRHHSVIKVDNGQHKIVDLGSNNGTYVNAEQVRECFLSDGDKITIGNTVFAFVNIDRAETPGYQIVLPEHQEEVETTPLGPPMEGIPTKTSGGGANVVHDESADRAGEAVNMLTPPATIAPSKGGVLAAPPPDAFLFADISNVVGADVPLEELCNNIFNAIDRVVPLECGGILLIGGGADDPPSTITWDKRAGLSSSVRIRRSIIEEVLTRGQAVLGGHPVATDCTESLMAIPLSVRGNLRGVIYLESGRRTRRFEKDDLRLVSTVAGYIGFAIESARRLERNERVEERRRLGFGADYELVGGSPRMRLAHDRILRIAATDATVLICGETGTGKELAARSIHQNSARRERPFETINCALLKEDLLGSELFGHEKGAFTGAVAQKKGRFEVADGGTLFLDEVGELPESTQSMLLRVLQERTFHRIGGTRLIEVDIRIIAATNRDLEKAVKEGTFRSDLYYRLNVVSVILPPLRNKREDIPSLVQYFLPRISAKNRRPVRAVSSEAMRYLQAYGWPGNVRELENAIEYAIVFGFTEEIQPEDLPERIVETAVTAGSPHIQYRDAVKEAKKGIVLKALRQANNNYVQAAKLLEIHVNNLHRLIRELDLKARVQGGDTVE